MQQLQVFATTPFYTNVAMNRGTISALELHERVLMALTQGVAIFSFLKVDGQTVKTVVATTNPAIIPSKVAQLGDDVLISAIDGYCQMYVGPLQSSGGKELFDLLTKFKNKLAAPPKDIKQNSEFQNYYDIQAQKWGKYKIDNLLSMILLESADGE